MGFRVSLCNYLKGPSIQLNIYSPTVPNCQATGSPIKPYQTDQITPYPKP